MGFSVIAAERGFACAPVGIDARDGVQDVGSHTGSFRLCYGDILLDRLNFPNRIAVRLRW